MAEVDLDRLAAGYDHRPERDVAGRVAAAVDAADPGPDDVVIDVGGGRGTHAVAIGEATSCRVVLVDPSPAMLAIAAGRGVRVVRARGEALPFADGGAVLVYFHLSIHHGDWRRMLDEAWRVTRPGGVVWVWTMDPEYHRRSHLAQWFPRVEVIDAARFPSITGLESAMRSRGGKPTVTRVTHHIQRPAATWIEAVRAGYVSTLHLLTDDEVAAGLARFEAAHPDPAETIEYDLELTGVWSVRASVES